MKRRLDSIERFRSIRKSKARRFRRKLVLILGERSTSPRWALRAALQIVRMTAGDESLTTRRAIFGFRHTDRYLTVGLTSVLLDLLCFPIWKHFKIRHEHCSHARAHSFIYAVWLCRSL